MKKYRVEAFIIPINNKSGIESNQIDDVKIAKKLKDQSFTEPKEESDCQSVDDKTEEVQENTVNISIKPAESDVLNSSDLSEIFFDINEHIYDEIVIPERKEVKVEKPKTEYTKAFFKVEDPIYDEPFIGNLTTIRPPQNENYDVPQTRWTLGSTKYRRFGIVAPKIPKRSSSLMSITEDIESFDDTLNEVCCHGRKDGCLPKNQRPEDISEEIFKENWMQKLDALRKLETLLKDKEVALQSRERLLFKKEKELKILERLVKDKMRQAELYAKRVKKSLSAESVSNNERNLESRSSNGSKGRESLSNVSNFEAKTISKVSLESFDEKSYKNPPNSRSSLVPSDRLSSRIGSLRSRSRPRQRMRYDDLDSTLSADVGDSSFIKTSEKFDPVVFKKPAAFARSASERRPRTVQQIAASRLSSLIEKNELSINELEGKVMERISKNILASQDLETKFLNYGSIDGKTEAGSNLNVKEMANQKRFSYLNLESINKTIRPRLPSTERPISWSEDADDWLKKKRQAYNEANKKIATEKTDKENFDGKSKLDKSNKVVKKKESHKKFSIFR